MGMRKGRRDGREEKEKEGEGGKRTGKYVSWTYRGMDVPGLVNEMFTGKRSRGLQAKGLVSESEML